MTEWQPDLFEQRLLAALGTLQMAPAPRVAQSGRGIAVAGGGGARGESRL